MANRTVILVPGILGSTLRDPYLPPPFGVVWLNPTRLLTGSFPRLRLAVPGESAPAPSGPPLAPGFPLPLYYGLLIAYLEHRGWRVVCPAADWRVPLPQDALRLRDLIRVEAKSGPVRLLCHSRGGLVARHALAFLSQLGELASVERVVGLGVPHTGSLEAATNLACWGGAKRKIEDLDRYIPAFFSAVLGTDQVRDVMRSWPALYELLPAPSASWIAPATVAALYVPATYASSSFRPVPAYLTAALAAWSSIPPVPAGVDWVDVAGVGVQTAVGVPAVGRIAERGSFSVSLAGDGVVPSASAHQSGRRLLTTPTQHDMLPLDGRLWPYLDQALAAGLVADIDLGGRVLRV